MDLSLPSEVSHHEPQSGQPDVGHEGDEEEDPRPVRRGRQEEGEGQGVETDVVGGVQGAERLRRHEQEEEVHHRDHHVVADDEDVEEGPGQAEFTLPGATLKKLIDDTAFAMAQQDVRYYLNGMLWEASSGLLRAVATDGHRLAMSYSEMPFSIPEKIQAIVPRKGVVELSRILSDEDSITVTLGSNHVRIQGSDFRFTSKLIDGAYPDYERVLPKGGSKCVVGDRELLRHAFARAAILSNEKYRGVRLQLEGDLLKITANNPEQEEAEEEVAVEYQGDGELEIGFNVNYLLDALNVLKGDNIRMVLTDANSSALLESPESSGALYVVMPMRL